MHAPRRPSVALLLPPVLISLVAFVLALIALLAGTGPQQQSLEPYHIIAVNLSNFGQDLIPASTSSGSESSETDDSDDSWFDELVDDAQDLGEELSDTIKNATNDIANEIADKIIKELGISQWYSLHVLSFCEGMFAPNASQPGAWFNLTNCTSTRGLGLDLNEVLDHEIKAGPLNVNLNQLPIPEKLQSAINNVNSALLALLAIYSLASGLAGLSFLLSLVVLVLLRNRVTKAVVWANVVIAGLGALVLLIGSAIVTYANNRGIKEINDAGKDVGITAIRGSKMITLSWVTFALMLITTLYWSVATIKRSQQWIVLADSPRHHNAKALP